MEIILHAKETILILGCQKLQSVPPDEYEVRPSYKRPRELDIEVRPRKKWKLTSWFRPRGQGKNHSKDNQPGGIGETALQEWLATSERFRHY